LASQANDDIRDGDYLEAGGEVAAAYAAYYGYNKSAMCIQCCVDDDKDDGKPQEE